MLKGGVALNRLRNFTAAGLLVAGLMAVILAITVLFTAPVWAASKKPNIVVIWGDDIGRSNLSTFTEGMMGYRTPNIDRIAHPAYGSPLLGARKR